MCNMLQMHIGLIQIMHVFFANHIGATHILNAFVFISIGFLFRKMCDLVSWLLKLNIYVFLFNSNDSKNYSNIIFIFVFKFLKL